MGVVTIRVSYLVVRASMGVELLGPVCLEGAVGALQGDLQMLRVNMVSHGGVELCPVALLASVTTEIKESILVVILKKNQARISIACLLPTCTKCPPESWCVCHSTA